MSATARGATRGLRAWPARRARFAPAVLRLGKEPEDFTDRSLARRRLPNGPLVLDAIAVPTAVAFLHDVPGLGEVANDAERRSFRDLERCGDVTQPDAGVVGDTEQRTGMVRQEAPLAHGSSAFAISNTRKAMLE